MSKKYPLSITSPATLNLQSLKIILSTTSQCDIFRTTKRKTLKSVCTWISKVKVIYEKKNKKNGFLKKSFSFSFSIRQKSRIKFVRFFVHACGLLDLPFFYFFPHFLWLYSRSKCEKFLFGWTNFDIYPKNFDVWRGGVVMMHHDVAKMHRRWANIKSPPKTK